MTKQTPEGRLVGCHLEAHEGEVRSAAAAAPPRRVAAAEEKKAAGAGARDSAAHADARERKVPVQNPTKGKSRAGAGIGNSVRSVKVAHSKQDFLLSGRDLPCAWLLYVFSRAAVYESDSGTGPTKGEGVRCVLWCFEVPRTSNSQIREFPRILTQLWPLMAVLNRVDLCYLACQHLPLSLT